MFNKPFFLKHGYHAEPVQLKVLPGTENLSDRAKKTENFVARLQEAQEFAAAAMAVAQQNMEEQANRKPNPASLFKMGDNVWLSLKKIRTPQPKKKLACINAK